MCKSNGKAVRYCIKIGRDSQGKETYEMVEDEHGAYVCHDDYKKLEDEVDRLRLCCLNTENTEKCVKG